MDADERDTRGTKQRVNQTLIRHFRDIEDIQKRNLVLGYMAQELSTQIKGCDKLIESLYNFNRQIIDSQPIRNKQKLWFAKLTLLLDRKSGSEKDGLMIEKQIELLKTEINQKGKKQDPEETHLKKKFSSKYIII